jgi:hypothetical protein
MAARPLRPPLVTMEREKGARYWKARAEALEAANRRLHERLNALAAVLPPEYVDDLESAPNPPEMRRPTETFVNLGQDGPLLTPATVEPDLRGLWARTAPPESD